MHQTYLTPTHEAGRAFVERNIRGTVIMLNLLRFKKIADYAQNPSLAPENTITGEEAYRLYINHTLPFLKEAGGEVIFFGKGGHFLIGPEDEYWDAVLLVHQKDTASFLAFENNAEYMKGIDHRTAALEDARLLPLETLSF